MAVRACLNCERRPENNIPSGSGERVAIELGAVASGCLNICNDYSVVRDDNNNIVSSVDGVNYTDGDLVATKHVDEEGTPIQITEVWLPNRMTINATDPNNIALDIPHN